MKVEDQKFEITWQDLVTKAIIIKAKTIEEAEGKFYSVDWDSNDVNIWDETMQDDSFDIEEVEE